MGFGWPGVETCIYSGAKVALFSLGPAVFKTDSLVKYRKSGRHGVGVNIKVANSLDLDVELFCEDLRNYAAGRKLKRLVDRSVGY